MSDMRQLWHDAIATIDSLNDAESAIDVFAACRTYTQRIGGSSLLIGRIANPVITGRTISSYGFSDWPDAFAKEWVANDYVVHDPITQYALNSRATFDWETAREQGSDYGKKIFDGASEIGMDKGVAIPVSAGLVPLGIVSVGLEEPLAPDILARLEMVAIHAYTRMLDFIGGEDAPPPIKLSKREVDVLNFTAIGKTAWDISRIYNISESTVRTHLRNIIVKLNASNKTHAVVKALRDGQIVP